MRGRTLFYVFNSYILYSVFKVIAQSIMAPHTKIEAGPSSVGVHIRTTDHPLDTGRFAQFSTAEFIAGAGAACIDVTATYPLSKIIFRQQLHGIPTMHAFADLKSEGLNFLYRGLLPPLMQKCMTRSVMFGMYDEYNK